MRRMNKHKPLLIGCATGFSGDRTDGVAPLVHALTEAGGGTLIYETLAERTLALAQLARENDPESGYEPLLDELVRPALAACRDGALRIVSNFGAANPPAAARRIQTLARQAGLGALRVAVVEGDALDSPVQHALLRERIGPEFDALDIVSAHAYLGAEAIADALRHDAQIVVAGRVADPSLTLGPALAHHDWRLDDWPRLGRATMAGHMLECGLQATGGYFCVPGLKEVKGLADAGYPLAEIDSDGGFVISKPDGTGGVVDIRTVKEQLLYEVHDPARYLTPDVIADISQARVEQIGPDRVAVHGVTGHARPNELKVNICHRGGWLAEGEISYAGVQAQSRAQLAADIVRKRLGSALRVDLIGTVSILGDDDGRLLEQRLGTDARHLRDVRLRLATSHSDRAVAERLLREVTALYTCGPAGGGGVRTSLRPRLNTISCTIARDAVAARWRFPELAA